MPRTAALYILIPVNVGLIHSLQIRMDGVPNSFGGIATFTMQKNDVDTSLVATVNHAANPFSGSNLVDSFGVVRQDKLSMVVQHSAALNSGGGNLWVTFLLEE